jgi:cytochrome c oxidase subunit 2
MVRALLLLLTLLVTSASAIAVDIPVGADPQALAEKLNPDIFALNPDGSAQYPMINAFTANSASDIARDVADNNWFNLLVYLPFLIAPQVLLIIVIFRFKDRGDGRKPATFMTNHKLEAIWTIIPILALLVVSVPVVKVLYKMELSPSNIDTNDPMQATVIKVTGHQFWWEYDYKGENAIDFGHDIVSNQEPVILVLDRPVLLNFTSTDVNHAWWVPAFAIKKSAIPDRFTNAWFTPKRLGVYKGNCAELCGEGHGIMFISALIVTPAEFDLWRLMQKNRADVDDVWSILQPLDDTPPASDAQLKVAVAKFFAKDQSPGRRFALRYWIDTNYQALHRCPSYPDRKSELDAHEAERKAKIDTLVADFKAPDAPLARQ